MALCSPVVAAAADWQPLPIDWPKHGDADDSLHVGGSEPNPFVVLPLDQVRGHWLRFSATEADADSGIGLAINVYQGGKIATRSAPSRCEVVANERRCATLIWVPADAARVAAVIWASLRPGDVRAPVVELATAAGTGDPPSARMREIVALVRARYYRSDDVDWPDLERAMASIPAPPGDADAVAAMTQWLRFRLTANKHTFLVLAEGLRSDTAGGQPKPTCDVPQGSTDPAIITVPGIGAISGDGPRYYAEALHDCLLRSDASQPWVVDLRGNGGGNMYPMIAGLAPLLHEGPLYAFVDGHGQPTAQIGLDAGGVTSNGQPVFPMPSDVGGRGYAPVVVLIGPRCASSCEQTANALAARPRTLFVGSATAGYTSANVPHPIDAHYTLLLTEGDTADPCGRVIADHLDPDIVVDGVDDRSVDALLRIDAVARWLADTRSRAGQPISADEREARCNGPRASRP